jgi:hypothetical protein
MLEACCARGIWDDGSLSAETFNLGRNANMSFATTSSYTSTSGSHNMRSGATVEDGLLVRTIQVMAGSG